MCALPIRSKLGMPSRNSGLGQSFGRLAAVRMRHQQIAAGRAARAARSPRGRRSSPRRRAGARAAATCRRGDAHRQLGTHLGQEHAGGHSRSGSAPRATLTLPKWKCPSSIASTSWLRWRRRLRRHRAAREQGRGGCTSASLAVRPVSRSNSVKGTRAALLQRQGGRAHLLADRQRMRRAAELPQPARGVPPSVVPSHCSGMWPSSEPDTSGTNTGSRPKASMISRSSSMSPGVRWLPGSTLIRFASQRGLSSAGHLVDQRGHRLRPAVLEGADVVGRRDVDDLGVGQLRMLLARQAM
jgi:hypothetical protein